jgi:hypothetical protein
MDHEVDAVARAFYDVSDYALPWNEASPLVRERLREAARTAIQSLDEYQGLRLVDDFLCVVLARHPAYPPRRTR